MDLTRKQRTLFTGIYLLVAIVAVTAMAYQIKAMEVSELSRQLDVREARHAETMAVLSQQLQRKNTELNRITLQLKELNGEKKAREEAFKRLADWEAKYPEQALEFAQADLKHFGITGIDTGVGVAQIPDDKLGLTISYLRKNGIACGFSGDLGLCWISVPAKDFYKAGNLLLKIKPQLEQGLHPNQLDLVRISDRRSLYASNGSRR